MPGGRSTAPSLGSICTLLTANIGLSAMTTSLPALIRTRLPRSTAQPSSALSGASHASHR
eukprot:scaffold2516_cov48-Phaeocystis_antarctica.AAC.1